MASDHEFGGPGVTKPHPKKNWVNPNAKQVHFASGEKRRSGPSRPSGPSEPSTARSGRSPLRLLIGLLALVVVLVAIALLLNAFVLD